MATVDLVATALLTYALHSFAACAIALLGARLIRRPQDRDIVWKVAFVAPIATTVAAMILSANGVGSPFVDLGEVARRTSPTQLPGRRIQIRVLQHGAESRVERSFSDPVTSLLSTSIVAVALLAVGAASARLIGRRRRLAHAVAGRREIGEVSLANGRTARLSSSIALQTPVAFNRVDICLPDDVVRDFSEPHQRSLIAHEMAHLERRDPAWFAATEIIAAVSAFQPLVTVIAREFRRDVELICDEAAVRRTNDQHSLISALALLASPFDPRSPLHGAATAYDGSPLLGRAERIARLQPATATPRPARSMVVAVVAVLAMLCTFPVVSAAPRLSDFPLDPGTNAGNSHYRRLVKIDDRSSSAEVHEMMTTVVR